MFVIYHLNPFVSHKCNSPNAPLPNFSTITNDCLGNSFNCCKSSSVDIASTSLYELNKFADAGAVFVDAIVPVDGVCGALHIAVVA